MTFPDSNKTLLSCLPLLAYVRERMEGRRDVYRRVVMTYFAERGEPDQCPKGGMNIMLPHLQCCMEKYFEIVWTHGRRVKKVCENDYGGKTGEDPGENSKTESVCVKKFGIKVEEANELVYNRQEWMRLFRKMVCWEW